MDLNKILMESAKLDERLHEFLINAHTHDPERERCCAILCGISFEHARSLKMLMAMGNHTSATGLMRLQYEALVRGMWAYWTAPDAMVSKLMADLTEESARVANKIPMAGEMLDALKGTAPKEATELLFEFREYSWKPLSSFVHGGIHAVDRNSKGYPLPLLVQMLKSSNGVSIMAAMVLVILSKNPAHRGKLPALQREFALCLPELK